MCGIAGAILKTNKITLQKEQLRNVLLHRGPDAQTFFCHQSAYFWHFRLSIIDISEAGAQPYHFENLILIYNGECYNYKQIKKELLEVGYTFQSTSDTEVLIKAFHCWREKAVEKMLGMFAFSIYDKITKETFLFRDRVGVKPLYYADTVAGFFFGSEIKVFYHLPIKRTINVDAVADYFRFGYTRDNKTIWNEIRKVPPGHYIHVTDKVEIKKYWSLTDSIDKTKNLTETQWLDTLEEEMISSFSYRMVADVPIGVFLSGGIDSSLVTSILQKYHGNINTFTIGFHENKFNEASYAKQVASYLGTNHIEKYLTIENVKDLLFNFYDIYDEPFADSSGIPTTIIAGLAKENGVKVVLSADGGDELFGGYEHYKTHVRLFQKLQNFSPILRQVIIKALKIVAPNFLRINIIQGNFEHRVCAIEELLKAQSIIDFYDSSIANQTNHEIENLINGYQTIKSTRSKTENIDPLQQVMEHDFTNYLPDDLLVKVDRATMHQSIESREPFLDHNLIALAYSMPNSLKYKDGKGKYPLREILSKYVPTKYFERPKQGFSIPIFQWFTAEFDNLFEHYLSEQKINNCGILNYREVEKEKRKYQYNKMNGHQHNIEKMWRLLSFMMWYDKWGKQ